MTDREKALKALDHLASWRWDDRETWLRVGMALHAVDEDLLDAWDKSSQKSEKYRAGECARQWRSFKGDGGVGLGTLLLMAKEDGAPPLGRGDERPRAPSAKPVRRRQPKSYRKREEAIWAAERQTGGKFVAAWPYGDATGFEVLRFDLPGTDENGKQNKTFRPLHYDGSGWVLVDPPAPLPLYRHDDLDDPQRIFVPEGEKCVEKLRELGLTATTSAHGAQSAAKTDWKRLAGKEVVFLPDRDDDGGVYYERAASILAGREPQPKIRVLRLGGLGPAEDVADWIGRRAAEGATREELAAELSALADEAPVRTADEEENERSEEPERGKLSQATQLVQLVEEEGVELFHDDAGVGYASLDVDRHRETWPLRKRGFKGWLAKLYFAEHGRVPSGQAVQDALGVLEGRAVHDGKERPVHVRVGEHEGVIYFDLGRPDWKAVRVDKEGWTLTDAPPVGFWRPDGLKALPEPQRGSDLRDLRRFVNMESDDDWVLYQAALVASLRPSRPFPVTVLNGEQGSCKSTTAKVARQLIDPNKADLRAPPRNERDLVIAAKNGWLIAFDNISKIRPWLSDALCRMATGGGYGTRLLYGNDEEALFDAKRPLVLTGIEDVVTQGDLLDRALVLVLPPLPQGHRLDEEAFWQAFERVRPRLLGALLDAVATALRRLPDVEIENLPRMADFARWAVAAEPGLDCERGAFLRAYRRKRAASDETAIEGSFLAQVVRDFVLRQRAWEGTATELLEVLVREVGEEKAKELPKSPSSLGNALRRVAPNLRAVGVEIEWRKEGGKGSRKLIRLGLQGADASDAQTPVSHSGLESEPSPTRARRHDGQGRRTNPLNKPESVGSVGGVAPLQRESSPDGDDWIEEGIE